MKIVLDDERELPAADESEPPPAHWPPGVYPISFDGLGHLGVSKDNFLHWDGKRLQTVAKLGWIERALAAAVALGTVSMAIVDILRFLKGA